MFNQRCQRAFETSFWLLRVSRGHLGGNAVEHDDSVSQVGRHDEVVLHHKRRLLGVEDVPANTKKGWSQTHSWQQTGGRKRKKYVELEESVKGNGGRWGRK